VKILFSGGCAGVCLWASSRTAKMALQRDWMNACAVARYWPVPHSARPVTISSAYGDR
jgi:hypothetical protein